MKLASGLSSSEQDAVIARDGGTETKSIAPLRLHVVDVPTSDADATFANYQNDPQVTRVELDKTREAGAIPSDPGYASQWALQRIGWDNVFGSVDPSGSAKLAVLDTGVSSGERRPEPRRRLVRVRQRPDERPERSRHVGREHRRRDRRQRQGHRRRRLRGEHDGRSRCRCSTRAGSVRTATSSQGVVWAADHGADVILMSFSNPGYSPALQDAIDYAWAQGAVVVAATGNDGSSTPTYPGRRREGRRRLGDRRLGLARGRASNYGPDTFLAAPGVGITADTPDGRHELDHRHLGLGGVRRRRGGAAEGERRRRRTASSSAAWRGTPTRPARPSRPATDG